MVKKYSIIYILAIVIFIASCSSMRSPNSSSKSAKVKSKSKTEKTNSINSDEVSEDSLETYERFKDTLTVVLAPVIANTHKSGINSELDEAVSEFENGDYSSACEKINVYAGIFQVGDSLYYESKYYEAECFVMNGKAGEAINLYRTLLNDYEITISVKERVIIRLGQLYCFVNDNSKAEFMFAQLKKEFPHSIYIKIANCDSIKKK